MALLPAPAAPTLLRIRRACSFTSSCEIRPPGPVPSTSLMLTPISRARRRTAGDAGAARPSGLTGGAGIGAALGGSTDRTGIETTLGCAAAGAGADACAGAASGAAFAAGGAGAAGAGCGDGAACAAGAPPPFEDGASTVRITAPTFTLSPRLTLISLTTPATDDGTSIVALSVSSSSTGCSFLIVSPTLTSTRVTSPVATFSPSSGTLNSVTTPPDSASRG